MEALTDLRAQWFAGSDVTFLADESSDTVSLFLYDQVHPTYGPMHGVLLGLAVEDDPTTLVVVDRY